MSGVDAAKKRIMSRISLSSLIGERVKLQNKSGNPMGCCPFHGEKTPSFIIYDDHYHCFGCGEHGDAIDYVRKIHGLEFMDALRFLADKVGEQCPELDQPQAYVKKRNEDLVILEVASAAQDFFTTNMTKPEGAKAVSYLKERGFSEENIKAFGFGVTSPEGWGLVNHLKSFGFAQKNIEISSLGKVSKKDSRLYDFFRSRLIIPIRDAKGRVVAFGGRTLDGSVAKYINSSDTPFFNKSKILFGFDKARPEMRQKHRAIVTEGYMDALQLWQQGFTETVACLGTALTDQHLKLLKNATTDVILLFDGDKAGQKASLSAVTMALSVPELNLKVAELPKGEDPDSYVRTNGPEALEKIIGNATNLLDYAIKVRLTNVHTLGVPSLVQKEFVPWLAKINDRMQRGFLISKISQLTGIPSTEIERELTPTRANQNVKPLNTRQRNNQQQNPPPPSPDNYGANQNQRPAPPPPDQESIPPINDEYAEAVMAKPLSQNDFELFGHLYFSQPGEVNIETISKFIREDLSLDQLHQIFANEILELLTNGVRPADREKSQWISGVSDEISNLLERLSSSSSAFDCNDREKRLDLLLKNFEIKQIHSTVSFLKRQLTNISATSNNPDETLKLLQSITDLNNKLNSLEKPEE